MKPAEFLDKVRAKNRAAAAATARANPAPAPAARAPAKPGRNDVTWDELEDAIGTACAELGDCSARQTLDALSLRHVADEDGDVVSFKGAVPVSSARLDAALVDVEQLELPRNMLGTLKRARAMLADAETQEAKAAAVPVTRAEFDALADATALALVVIVDMIRDSRAGSLEVCLEIAAQAAEFKSASAGIQALRGRLEKARGADGARQRRNAWGRPQVYPGASNF